MGPVIGDILPVALGVARSPVPVIAVILMLLGLAAVALAARQWRGRPTENGHASLPAWMSSIDQMTPVSAVGLAGLLPTVNPENLTLCPTGWAQHRWGEPHGGSGHRRGDLRQRSRRTMRKAP